MRSTLSLRSGLTSMLLVWGLASGLALGLAPRAAAELLLYDGSISLELGTLPPVVVTGTGVAEVNGSGTSGHLETLALMKNPPSAVHT